MSLSRGWLSACGSRSIIVRLMLEVEAPSLVRRLLSRALLNSWVLASSAVCAAVVASTGVASGARLIAATGFDFGLFFVLLTRICGRCVWPLRSGAACCSICVGVAAGVELAGIAGDG